MKYLRETWLTIAVAAITTLVIEIMTGWITFP